MTAIYITVPGQPRPLMRHRSTRPGHSYDPPENRRRKAAIVEAYMRDHAGRPPIPKGYAVMVCVDMMFKRPKRLGEQNVGLEHTVRPDLDNVIKLTFDALNGLAWNDDAQVSALSTTKRYCHIGEQPGIIISIDAIKQRWSFMRVIAMLQRNLLLLSQWRRTDDDETYESETYGEY